MAGELELSTVELMIYALIYGFSQEEGGCYRGSLLYLSEWVHASRSTVRRCLSSLIDAGLIIRRDVVIKGVRYPRYRAVRRADGDGRSAARNEAGSIAASKCPWEEVGASQKAEHLSKALPEKPECFPAVQTAAPAGDLSTYVDNCALNVDNFGGGDGKTEHEDRISPAAASTVVPNWNPII